MTRELKTLKEGRRAFFIVAGLACVGVGVAGIFVPGLPTTVFLLAASYLFARSSPRLHRWLSEHPRLGPYLRQVRAGAMPWRTKIGVLAAMWGGITLSWFLIGDDLRAVQITVLGLGLIGTAVVVFYVRTAPAMSPAQVARRNRWSSTSG